MMSRVAWLKSQEGVRMPACSVPVIRVSVSAARSVSERSAAAGRSEFRSWIQPCSATSWPPCA